jgi:AcrR family transcriptional regulator
VNKGVSTRENIVAEALRQTARVGFDGLSFGALADGLGMSKSGLFAHFRAKEALQLAVLAEANARFEERVVTPALGRPRGRERLVTLFAAYLDWMRDGCVYSMAAQEMDQLPGPMRTALQDGLRQWQETIAKLAEDAVTPERVPEVVLQFIGLALAYQQTVKVFQNDRLRDRVLDTFQRTLGATT